MSAVTDEIERLGAAVERGELGYADAAYRVAQASDGGLDLDTADDLLRHWRTARASCEALYARAADQLIALALLRIDAGRGAR